MDLLDFMKATDAITPHHAKQAANKARDAALIADGIPEEVLKLFESLTLKIIMQGFKHYSADAVLHRIRWHMHIERGDRDFKANNNWTASLARWFMAKHPEHDGFFETRESPRNKGE